MFGLSWEQIILILLAALFVLGPERIPTAIKWAMDGLRKLRTFAAGAQSEMRSQLGPELDELRRQVAELQSLKELKELKELRELRDLDPRRIIGKTVLGDEFSGGVKGFLGLTGAGPDSSNPAGTEAPAAAPAGTSVGAAVPAATSASPAVPPPAATPSPGDLAPTAPASVSPDVDVPHAPSTPAAPPVSPGPAPAAWSDVT